jgi:hypothetical protein
MRISGRKEFDFFRLTTAYRRRFRSSVSFLRRIAERSEIAGETKRDASPDERAESLLEDPPRKGGPGRLRLLERFPSELYLPIQGFE